MLLDFDELDLFVGIVILVVLLAILWRQKRSPSYLFCFSVFWVYLVFVVKEAVFPIHIPGVDAIRQETFMPSVNLIPLYFGDCSMPSLCIRGIVENIVLTVPFGFGVSFIAQLRVKDFLWLAIAVGFGLESTQLVISLAFRSPFRVIDVNDVLLNATGVLFGYGFFRIFAWLYVAMTWRLGIKHTGLSAYVHDITSRAQITERAMPGKGDS